MRVPATQHPRQKKAITHNANLPSASFSKLPPELHLNIASNSLSLDTFHALQLTSRNIYNSYHPSFNQFYPEALLDALPLKIKLRIYEGLIWYKLCDNTGNNRKKPTKKERLAKKRGARNTTENQSTAKNALTKMRDILYSYDVHALDSFLQRWEEDETDLSQLFETRFGTSYTKQAHEKRKKHEWYEEELDQFKHQLVLQALRRAIASPDTEDLDYLELLLERFKPKCYSQGRYRTAEKAWRKEIVTELGGSRYIDYTRIFSNHVRDLFDWFDWSDHPLIKACAEKDLEYTEFLIHEIKVLNKDYFSCKEKQLALERAMCAVMTIPTSFPKEYDGVYWIEGKEGGERWEKAFENLTSTSLEILKIFYRSGRVDWTSLRTHTISAIMNSSTFNKPNCLNNSAPEHIANKYTWILIERVVEYLMLEARIIATSKLLEGKVWPIMKWVIVFAVRPSAHPRERQHAIRIIELLTKVGLFIDWEEAVSGEERRAFRIDEKRRENYILDLQEKRANSMVISLLGTRRQNHPPLITIQERWGDMWEDVEMLCREGQKRHAQELSEINLEDACPGCGKVHAAERVQGGPEPWEETDYSTKKGVEEFGMDPYPMSYWE